VSIKPVIFAERNQKKTPGFMNHFVVHVPAFLPGAHPKNQAEHDQSTGDGSLLPEPAGDL
jgi:hypothetical protein